MHVLVYDESERIDYQYVVMEIDESVTRLSRDQLVVIDLSGAVWPDCARVLTELDRVRWDSGRRIQLAIVRGGL